MGQTAIPRETIAIAAPRPRIDDDARGVGARLLALFAASASCGLAAGLLEVAAFVVHQKTLASNQFYGRSRHFVWMVPLADLTIFLLAAVALAPLVALGGGRGRRWSAWLLGTLALLAPLWALTPTIYGPAGLLLAMGASARLAPWFRARSAVLQRAARRSLPILLFVVAALWMSAWAPEQIAARREAARPAPPPETPNLLLIVLDTVRADHLGTYGYKRPTSPAIDEIAARAVRFDNAQSAAPWTLPSHASMFTGKWPHDLAAGWLTPLTGASPLLAEFLSARGHATAGFVANHVYCGADSGLARGFTVYRDYRFPRLTAFCPAVLVDRPLHGLPMMEQFLEEHLGTAPFRPAIRTLGRLLTDNRIDGADVNRRFLDWLDARRGAERDRPFFAFLNYFDAHFPYMVPETGLHRFRGDLRGKGAMGTDEWLEESRREGPKEQQEFLRDCYDDCIAHLDEQIGRLMDELKRRSALDRTWLIVVSDHGESFGEHPGVFRHGGSLYQTELHVPLLIVPPGGRPTPLAVPDVVSLRDLAATIADLLGHAAEAPFPGRSLARFWRAPGDLAEAREDDAGPKGVLAEVVPIDVNDPSPSRLLEPRSPLGSWYDGQWSYIRREGEGEDHERGPHEELFHSAEDPGQQRDRAAAPIDRPALDHMRDALRRATNGPLVHGRFPP